MDNGKLIIDKDGKGETSKKMEMMVKHAHLFEKYFPDDKFFSMRKHLAWYIKGFDGASAMRSELMQANSAFDVEKVVAKWRDRQ